MNYHGVAIKRIRSALDLTIGEFAHFVGLSAAMISSVENGSRHLSEDSTLDLCATLGVSREEFRLLGDPDDTKFSDGLTLVATELRGIIVRAVAVQMMARKHLGLTKE